MEDAIKEKFCEHTEMLEDLDDRVKYLELSDTETKTELKNLISVVKELIVELKEEKKQRDIEKEKRNTFIIKVGGTAIIILVGFFIWYIQKG